MSEAVSFVNISAGNIKTGAIPSYSLPAGRTCSMEACRTCYKDCYARRYCEYRPSVQKAYERNLMNVTTHPQDVERELDAMFDKVNCTKLFRIHVSGDFFSSDYFEMWLRIIRNHPHTQFLAFTKQADIIRPYLNDLPANLSLVWSAWPGVPVPKDIRKALPVAWMQDGTEKRVPGKALECPGHCDDCGRCWALAGNDVVFHKH